MEKNMIKIGYEHPLPLLGHIAFGFIDRGTNVIQTRPISGCSLNCIFCSIDEGPHSKTRTSSFEIDCEHMLKWAKMIAKEKECNDLQWHIDCAGEATMYKDLQQLISGLKEMEQTRLVSMETKACPIPKSRLQKLKEAGLSQINLSIDAMDPDIAKKLAGTSRYDIEKYKELAQKIVEEGFELIIAPVWVPCINDSEIPKIIEFAKELGATLGIQKYEAHKLGRKPKGVKPLQWKHFWTKIKKLEKEFDAKLRFNFIDLGIHRAKRLKLVFKKFEKTRAKIVCRGWIKGEMLGVSKKRSIACYGCEDVPIGSEVVVKILRNNDGIYVATRIK